MTRFLLIWSKINERWYFGMHMADALVAPAVATTMYLCSAAAGGYSVRQVRALNEPKKVPVMGVMGALFLSTQMINFTIPGTGSSGHLCGGMLLSALLGPYAGFLTMIGVLLIQCLLFADGGLLALGCNIWNMAFYGCFIGALLIWKPMMRRGASKKENRCSICTWLCPDAAAWSIFRYIRDVSFRYHGASISDICCSDAADPSGNRSGRRTDHGSSALLCL